jgi:type IV secretory pathway TrbD component
MTQAQEITLLRVVLSGTIAALVSLLLNLPIWVCALIGVALVLGGPVIIFMINTTTERKRRR